MLVCVDFFATWCPPCRMIAPILEEMSKEFEGKVAFLKVRIISIDYLFIHFWDLHILRLMSTRQRRSQVKKVSKPCQHLSSIRTENDLKTLLEPIKTESEAPLQNTHEFAWIQYSPQNKFEIIILLNCLLDFHRSLSLLCLKLRIFRCFTIDAIY